MKRLEKIAEGMRIPNGILHYKLEEDYTILDFLAERIELLNKSTIYQKIEKDSVREEVFFSDNYIKNFKSGAAITFDFFGRVSFDMAIRENDDEWIEISKKSFSNVITCYKGLGKDTEKTGFLLTHLPLLKEIVSIYFIRYNYPKSMDRILDYVNKLTKIKHDSKEAEEIENRIYENCQLIPKNEADKIDNLVNSILSDKINN
ncbi:MAG: hypothetical protein KJ968_03845 [Nanoarchaeota archaeon]|nr:hypothetical protein [Nanoarchaeota archaeon]